MNTHGTFLITICMSVICLHFLILPVCLLELYAISVDLFLEVDKTYKHYSIHIYDPNPANINLAKLRMVTSVFKSIIFVKKYLVFKRFPYFFKLFDLRCYFFFSYPIEMKLECFIEMIKIFEHL